MKIFDHSENTYQGLIKQIRKFISICFNALSKALSLGEILEFLYQHMCAHCLGKIYYVQHRDVITGATRATAVAPKFTDTLRSLSQITFAFLGIF